MVQFKELQSIFSRIIHLGVQDNQPEIAPFIIQSNLNGLIFFFLDFFLAAVFFFTLDESHISYGLMTAAFSFLLGSVGFNALGRTTLSRLSTVLIGSLLVVYCALYLGPQSFAAASLLTGAIFPFVYFNLKERKLLAFTVIVPLFCYGFLLSVDYHFGPRIQIQSRFNLIVLQLVFFLVPFISIVTNTLTAVSQREMKTEELAESQSLLKAIFGALFHDLANPAMMVFMVADTAYKKKTMNEQAIERLHRVTDQMKRVLNKLKKMTSITGGKNQLQYESISLFDLAREAVSFAENQAHAKGVHLVVDPSDCNKCVKVDRDIFIFQVLMNFLTNAIKFTESGKTVTLSIHSDPDNKIRLDIRDEGIGIPATKIPHLTSWKSHTSTTGTNGEVGTGLGLPLAHKFLILMGGNLVIQSRQIESYPDDHGTTVSLVLPISANEEKTTSEPSGLSKAS